MTRLAIDTAVFVNALFHASENPGSVLLLRVVDTGIAKLLTSEETVGEILSIVAAHGIEAKLDKRRIVPPMKRVARLLWSGERVNVTPQFKGCGDPTDDKFVDLAVQGKADYLVTQDGHISGLENPPVPVVSPWQLMYRECPDLRPKAIRRPGE